MLCHTRRKKSNFCTMQRAEALRFSIARSFSEPMFYANVCHEFIRVEIAEDFVPFGMEELFKFNTERIILLIQSKSVVVCCNTNDCASQLLVRVSRTIDKPRDTRRRLAHLFFCHNARFTSPHSSLLFRKKEVGIDDLEADIAVSVANHDALALLFLANNGLAFGILDQ